MIIKEINLFRELLAEVQFNSWLLLDLDNTVMTSKGLLGGDAWFEAMFIHLNEKNINSAESKKSLLSIYCAVQHYVRTIAVEPNAVMIIKALQSIGIPVIGLTARGPEIKHETVRQLENIGISFAHGKIPVETYEGFYKGIIFCDGADKGIKFRDFLHHTGSRAKNIVMLDDKRKHLERVMFVCKDLGIDFTGLRYGFLDETVKQFDLALANEQLLYLSTWLSKEVQQDALKIQLIENLSNEEIPEKHLINFFLPTEPLVITAIEKKDKVSLQRSESMVSIFSRKVNKSEIETQSITLKLC